MKKIFCIVVFLLIFFYPFIAMACPLCQSGQGYSKASIFAYKETTLLLALLPFAIGGGIYLWIRRKLKKG